MSPIKFGCQFYTWQMSGERYVGKLPHILKVVEAAGFSGIEPETWMLGDYYQEPAALADVLAQHGLGLGAIAFVCDWAGEVESQAEREEAADIIRYMQAFPAAHLVLCQMPGKDRTDLRQRQKNLISCVNSVSAARRDRGSPAPSIQTRPRIHLPHRRGLPDIAGWS